MHKYIWVVLYVFFSNDWDRYNGFVRTVATLYVYMNTSYEHLFHIYSFIDGSNSWCMWADNAPLSVYYYSFYYPILSINCLGFALMICTIAKISESTMSSKCLQLHILICYLNSYVDLITC
jgi:hypothetical protein